MQKKNKKKVTLKDVLLPRNIIPLEYDIQMRPDLKNFTFEGIETIFISILKSTNTITLHSKDIEIETAQIAGEYAKITYNESKETATFVLPKPIKKGAAKFTLVFKGILNDKMRGFYRSKYSTLTGQAHMATTQFEATDARRAFPCFDEPALKSIFHVSLIVEKGQTAISNTLPISVAEHNAEYEIVKFAPTPRMSTYLLAFIVGEFEFIESYTKSDIKVRIFTAPGKKHQAKFALDCAVKFLEFYEEYFDIKYPLNTLDMIAIPDFSSAAMENWGAITYRESAILVDEDHSSTHNREWVAIVIAHELAHQWFGNLVTMEWWTHLWLNEGFASFISYLAVDNVFPKWDIWTQFSVHDRGVALRLDSLLNTHPIEIPVHHPDEIGEIFDEVSYSKGASIILMLSEYIGQENFREGLSHYLKKHSYKNTETVHLWQSFEKVSKKNVSKMMKTWTSKPGYPVIHVEEKNGKLKFKQERFFVSPQSKRKANDKTKWVVPVTFQNHKVNYGETGFYRVAYSKEMLDNLRSPIENKLLNARDRLGIIRDLFALGEAGTTTSDKVLEFLSVYKNETDYSVWVEIASGLAKMEQLVAKSKFKKFFDQFVISLFEPNLQRLGWQESRGESHTDTLLRSLTISRLGRSGYARVVMEAREIFKMSLSGEEIDPDIRGALYATVARSGGEEDFKIFLKKYKNETLHEEKNRIGSVLGDFKHKKILEQVCEFAMSEHVRVQDTVGILSSVGANPHGRDIWWSFVKKNWKTLVSRYGEGGLTLARSIKAIGGSPEEKHLNDFKKFFKSNEAPGAARTIEQMIEKLEGNVLWLKRDAKKLEKFFQTYKN